MTASSTLPAPNLMPLIRYRDLAEAMSWLEQAFDFEKQIAVSDSDGEVIYGQMTYRGSLIMMGAVRDTDLDKLMRQPDEVGGVETQSCYLVVDDADAHYARALDAGADVALEIKSDGLGRRGYSCRDPEGHIWNFGTYNPGKGLTVKVAAAPEEAAPTPARRRSPRILMSLVGLFLLLGGTSWWFADEVRSDLSKRFADAAGRHSAEEAERAYAELVKVRTEKRKADELSQALTLQLEAERARRLALETNAGKASGKIAQEERARHAAETEVASLGEELKRVRQALDAAVEAKRVSEEKLAVKSAAADAASQSEQTETKPEPLAAVTSEIETSATGSGAQSASTKTASAAVRDEDDDEPRASLRPLADENRRMSRPSGRAGQKSRRPAAKISKPQFPAYVVDVTHIWPYNSWSN